MELKCDYSVCLGYGFNALIKHMALEHNENIKPEDEGKFASWREFDFLCVLSGRGHKEKNMMNVLYDFHWEVLIEHCLEILGFSSLKQNILIRKTKDHHLSFDFIKVLTEAVDREISHHICIHLKKQGWDALPPNLVETSSHLIGEWSEINQNFRYLIILRRNLKAINLHHIGMRLNRSDLKKSSPFKRL